MMALVDIVSVRHLGEHRLELGFSDGVCGEVDLSSETWTGVLEPLADTRYFALAHVDPELGTVVWPGGEDLAPEPLYERCRPSA